MWIPSEKYEDLLQRMIAQTGDAKAETARAGLLSDEVTRLVAQNDQQAQEIRRLTDVIVQMKREGFHPAITSLETPEPEVEPLDPDILRAIGSVAEPGSRLHGELVADALHMRDVEDRDTGFIISTTLRGGAYQGDEAWQDDVPPAG